MSTSQILLQGPTRDYSGAETIHGLFQEQVRLNPNIGEVRAEGRNASYSEVNADANRLAGLLIERGIVRGDLVGICLPPSVDLVVSMLAVLKAGAAFVLLDSTHPHDRIEYVVRDSSVKVIICSIDTSHYCPRGIDSMVIDMIQVELAKQSEANPSVPVAADDIIYVMYTSGTMGPPKGAILTHRGIRNRVLWGIEEYDLRKEDAVLFKAPISFDVCIWEVFAPLLSGANLVVARPGGARDFSYLIELMRTEFVTHADFVPSMMSAFLSGLKPGQVPSLRVVTCAGEALTAALLAKIFAVLPVRVYNLYGPTEASLAVTWWVCSSTPPNCEVPIGRPMSNVWLHVLRPDGDPVVGEEVGELYIGGLAPGRGYLNQPDLTAVAFLPDRFAGSGVMYRTGDLVRVRDDGEIMFLGRADHQVKVRGQRVELGEVEAALSQHSAIEQAVVISRDDISGDKRLDAYLVLSQEQALTIDEIRHFLQQRLPTYMVPSAFVVLDVLPLTTNGKLDRNSLPAPSFSGDLQQRVDPSTDLEHQLHGIWAEVLGHSDFGITDNFFAIGGHSLAAARLVSRIEQAIGSAPTLAAFFQNPSIAGLIPLLSASSPAVAEAQPIPAAESLSGAWPQHCQAFPASYAQSRLWFLHQLQPDLTAYHMPAVWRLSGTLDLNALRLALAVLIERHPTLRTSFCLQGSEVVQLIHPPAPFPLDAESLADRSPDAVIEQWLEQERTTPFDLTSGLLLRARLLAVDHQHHLLLLNHHHIASDGWSLSLLSRDLTELYNAHRTGRASQLAPLRVLYHDYAAWQRQRLTGDRLQTLQDYWIPQLTGLEPLELPSDHPRPATPSHQGASVSFQITPELLAPFEQLCRLEGATLQMGLLALLALLLHRYSRQDDVAIGVPSWGRNHPDLEPLIGFFVNTLPIRTRFTTEQSFRQLLQQVKTSSLAAYDHQELPFEQIVEALNLPRDTSRNPLVQVMLQLIELPETSLQSMEDLVVDALDARTTAARLELEFFLRRSPNGGIHGGLCYATDLFNADRAARLTSHLIHLLSAIPEAPDAPSNSLSFLSQSERLLIETWQHGSRIDPPELCVHQLFEQQAERTPDAIALIFADQQISYADLNARANQLAHQLIDLGIGPGQIVAVSIHRSIELIVALLAVLKAGGAYLPLDPAWPQSRQELLRNAAGCSVLLSSTGPVALSACGPASSPATAGSLAYVIATSGSTGTPKAVAVEHGAILRLFDSANGFFLEPGTRLLQLAPLAFDAATFEIWGPLLHGGTLVLAPPGQLSLSEIGTLLHEQHITTLWLTAGLFHSMVDAELHSLAGVRQVLAGGDVLSPEHVQRLLLAFPPGHQLINGYGPTENTTFTCCHDLVAGDSVDPAGVSIGRPIAGTTVRILNGSGQPCPIGIPGELHIGGAGLARGYLNNAELTADKFLHDPFSSDPTARLYKSGDLASWNSDGTLAFHGRIDQQIKLRGFRIEPGEIEAQLLTHPAVAQAVVVLRNDDPSNPRLIAYWVADASQPTLASSSFEQLRAFLADRLPDYMVPAAFLQLEALPLTPNGKLDRKALPAPCFSGNPGQRVDPSTDLEHQLHAIWAEVLGHSNFGITDNFFAIGGHSLAAARLVARINETFQCADPLLSFFKDPTIRGHGSILSGVEDDRYSCIVPMQPDGDKPPLFIIHGWGGKISGWVHLARAFAPDRPVFGVQSFGADHNLGPQGSIEEMTERYAAEILRQQPSGIIHLMGFSAGGWYAYAVAKALLERGGYIGMLALLDTYPTTRTLSKVAQLTRFIGLLTRRSGFHIKALLAPGRDQGRAEYIIQRYASLGFRTRRMLGFELPFTSRILLNGTLKAEEQHKPAIEIEPFVGALNEYMPLSIPIHADIFAPLAKTRYLNNFWRRYILKGVTVHPIFNNHMDFPNSELASELHAELEEAMSAKDR